MISSSEQLRKPKAIIMTVGLKGDQGGDVIDALMLDFDATQPEFLALIASGQSMNNARRLIERCGLPAEMTEIVELTSAQDIGEIFQQSNALVLRLNERGYLPEDIAINYTSGTKVMGAGAVLSAVYNRIMELRYITGITAVREGGDARHRIVTTKPGAVLAYQQMLLGRRMLLDLHYMSGQKTLDEVQGDLLSEEDAGLLTQLRLLTRAYGEWDNFFPDRFLDQYRQARFGHESLERFRMTEEGLAAVNMVYTEIARGQMGAYVITDLFNNAWRRLQSGRHEDAVARVYRALEMLAQWILARDFDLDTNDLDTRRIPPRDRVGYEALRSTEDGRVRIGMRRAYELLVILDAPVGKRFAEDEVIHRFLHQRAESILAHGLQPVPASEARIYINNARDLFSVEIEDFDRLAAALQFPWLLVAEEPALKQG